MLSSRRPCRLQSGSACVQRQSPHSAGTFDDVAAACRQYSAYGMSNGQLAMPGFRRKLFDEIVQRWNAGSKSWWLNYIGARSVHSALLSVLPHSSGRLLLSTHWEVSITTTTTSDGTSAGGCLLYTTLQRTAPTIRQPSNSCLGKTSTDCFKCNPSALALPRELVPFAGLRKPFATFR